MQKKALYTNDYDYVSWISNVSGRLFFHLTDGYNYRYDRIVGDVIHFNHMIGDKRFFFISLLADLRDIEKVNHSKFTRVIISASVDTSDCNRKVMKGNVYLIDDKINNGLRRNDFESKFLKKVNTLITSNTVATKNLEENLKEFIDNYNTIDSIIVKNIGYCIQDTGVIHLKKNDSYPIKDGIDADVQAAFYLLKFTLHKDRHHSTTEENIIRIICLKDIYKCNINKKLECSKDYMIAKYLIEGIKQYIAEKRKRHNNSKTFYNLKGVLNYTQTMMDVFMEYLPSEECIKFLQHEQRCLLNLNASIERELEKKPYKPATFYEFLPELKNILFLPLLILSAIYAIVRLFPDIKETLFISSTDIVAYYIGTLAVGVWIIEIIRNNYYKDDTFFLMHVYRIPEFFLRTIKKYSQPNISNKINLFKYYIFPFLINIEMDIRRNSAREKTFYIVLLLGFFLSTVLIIAQKLTLI